MVSDCRFDVPLYTVAGAARLVGMPTSTLTDWAKGYERAFRDRAHSVQKGPVITALRPTSIGAPSIPFVGLVEAVVVQAFRRTSLPMPRIRKALEVLARDGDLAHALASRRLFSDGAQVLFDYANETSDGQLRLLTVVSTGQRVFHEVITEYLERICFDSDEWADELIVPVTKRKLLRVRANVSNGDPIFIRGGAPLSAVTSRFQAGETLQSISRDYDLVLEDVAEVIDAFDAIRAA